LHRQLALLDRMERRTTDPDELEDLFRVDHLATRMRRHAEDLVILAGATAGRGWRNPVPMIDVIRGAISEVEDYTRVDIQAIQPAATVGHAVGDVIHLLSELLENATSFSPPHTRVHVTGQIVGRGYAIEVEDRGLGMTPEAIDEANRRLADPPDFDPANSARLGLFVVAQLAARTGVKVQLRASPYGGITAVALLPSELVVTGPGALALPPAGRPQVGEATVPTRAAVARPPVIVGQVERPPAVPAPRRPARERPSVPPPPMGEDGLPRRVRPARGAGPAVAGGAMAAREAEPEPRDPDDVRAVMSALQSGTARGRQAAGGEPGTPKARHRAGGESSNSGGAS